MARELATGDPIGHEHRDLVDYPALTRRVRARVLDLLRDRLLSSATRFRSVDFRA